MWGPQDSYVGEHNYKFVVVRTTNRLDYIATYIWVAHIAKMIKRDNVNGKMLFSCRYTLKPIC